MSAVVKVVKKAVNVVVDVVEDVVGAVGDAVEWVVDEVIEPVVEGVGDVIEAVLDDPITTIAKVAAVATGQLWAIPLIDGASTIAKGGDLDDALKSAAVSYVTQTVGSTVSTYVAPSIATAATNAGVSKAVTAVVQTAVVGGTEAAATALIYGQNPLDAFLEGGLNSAVGATIGQISDSLDAKFGDTVDGTIDDTVDGAITKVADGVDSVVTGIADGVSGAAGAIIENSGWENLQDGVKDIVVAGITAELTGGDVSATQIGNIVAKYTGVTKTVSTFLDNNTNLDDKAVSTFTSAITNAATTALAGDPNMTSETFFATLDAAGAIELKAIIDKPVNSLIDKVSGTNAAVEEAAAALREVETKATEAANGFNGLRDDLNGRVQEQDRLKGLYNAAVDAHNANPTQATLNAANSAASDFNTYADDLDSYYAEIKPQMDQYETTHSTYVSQLGDLQATYDENTQYLMSDMADLDEAMKPIYTEANRAVATVLRPGINEDTYRRLNGLDAGEDVYTHYLSNSSRVQVFDPAELNEANPDAFGDGYTYDAENNRYYVDTPGGRQQVDPYAEYGAGSTTYDAPELSTLRGNVAPATLGTRITKDMNNILGDAAPVGGVVLPEHFKALRDAGYNIVGIKSASLGGRLVDGTQDYDEMVQEFEEYTEKLTDEDTVMDQDVLSGVDRSDEFASNKAAADEAALMSQIVYDEEAKEYIQSLEPAKVYSGRGLDPRDFLTYTVDGTMQITPQIQNIMQDALGYSSEEMDRYFPVGDTLDADIMSAGDSAKIQNALIEEGYEPLENRSFGAMAAQVYADELAKDPSNTLSPAEAVVKSILVGAPENLARMIEGIGIGSTALRNEARNYFGYGGLNVQDILETTTAFLNPNSYATEMELNALIGSAVTAIDADSAAQLQSRMDSFDGKDSAVQYGTEYVADFLDSVATGLEDMLFTPEQKAIINASGFEGDRLSDLKYFGKDGNIAGLSGQVANEVGGEIIDLFLKGNPYVVGASAALNAGEAVSGADSQISQTLDQMESAGVLQATDIYKDALAAYDGDADKAKAFVASEILRDSILKVSTVGAVDAFLPGAGKNLIKNATIRGGSEGAQEVAESAFVLDSVNKVLDTNLNIYKDAAGNFVMGAMVGSTTQVGGEIIDIGTKVFGDKTDGTTQQTIIAPELPPEVTTKVPMLADPSIMNLIVNNPTPTSYDSPVIQELTSKLQELGIDSVDTITNIANFAFDSGYTTKAEVEEFVKLDNPEFTFTGSIADNAFDQFTGAKSDANLATEVAAYIDPLFTTREEAIEAATAEGVVLTDDQIDAIVGDGNVTEEDIAEVIDENTVNAEEVQEVLDELGYEATEEEVNELIGTDLDLSEEAQVDIIEEYVDDRQVTEEEAREFFEEQGYDPTDEEVAAQVNQGGEGFEDKVATDVGEYVGPRQVTEEEVREFFEEQGYEPTDAEVADRVGQGGDTFETDTKTGVGTYVDPRQVTDEEARQFFADLGYNDPTDEQVAQFVAQVEETTQKDVISKYVDPRQVTQAEIQAIADEEGLTLTEALAATYLGQSESDTFQTEQLDAARTEYDPLATTLEEATQFFADTGYTADTDEIAQFVASKTEEVQTSAIGAYVDPRQMTSDEAREFLSEVGYNPTDQEVADFTGQLNDDSYQITQKTAIDDYVDPRYFDAGEVRAAYEELGLVDVTQEDVDRFVGQYDPETGADAEGFESARMDELREYMPVATVNVIKRVIGSPSVEDDPNTEVDESKDATGIYAELESGATRDEALQTAIDKVATDLGTTKEDLLEELGFTEERLGEEINAVVDDVAEVKEDVTEVKEDVGDLADILGTAGIEDDPDTEADETQDPTGLFATIKAYEDAGLDRDEALQKAIDDVAGALGTTKDELLDAIGESETTLTGKIDTATDTLTETIGEVETNLGADIDAVADLVGKPARDVTQTDIDFVIDLIAQENVSAELTTQYDVNADGIVDITDQTMLETALQGEQDVTLADTSMFNPATGLYLQQEQDTQSTQDLMTELNTQLNTQVNNQSEALAKQAQDEEFRRMRDAGMFQGATLSAKTPDPMNIDYLYDFESIFANPAQEGLFDSPYGNRRARPANQPASPASRASGFAQGGQVEDENDMLLRILGDM